MKLLTTLSFLVVSLSLLILPETVRAEMPKKGADAPTFKVTTLEGKEVNFPGDYKGKLVIIDFWATWCGFCMDEMPGFVQAYNEYHPKGLEVLGFSVDKPDDAETVKKVMKEKHMNWAMCLSKNEMKGHIPQMYGINIIPSQFLVDGDTGKIIAGAGGALRGANLAKTLEAAFKEKKAAAAAK